MHIDEFDYHLPEGLIAQRPINKRDASRLMVLNRQTGMIEHKHFYDLLEYIRPGDCLVLNNSKVIPARIFGIKKETGAKIEFLLIKRKEGDIWEVIVRPGKRLKIGDVVDFSNSGDRFEARIIENGEEGIRLVQFTYDGIFLERLDVLGKMPLPPYIHRESEADDKERYQTVYCMEEGSVAAPTAGLHFTETLLAQVENMGVHIAYVTLHVGIGTFRPVKCELIEDHKMHFEEYEIDEKNAKIINKVKEAGGRIISVGTTSTRTLESAAQFDEQKHCCQVKAGTGSTGIFIYPGYKFKMIDSLVTNFHLPKSTLLMLISALYSREAILKAYEIAIEEKYRFFSYGDSMVIL